MPIQKIVSKVGVISQYGKAGSETHGQKEGTVAGAPNENSERAMAALMKMGKLDIAALEQAYHG